MALKIPDPVVKILKRKTDASTKFNAIRGRYKYRIRATSGCFAVVLLCRGFVLKRNRRDGDCCSIEDDFKFIQKMRSDPAARRHFPNSRLIGNIMVQERADRNPTLYKKYARQIQALAAKFGVDDAHDYNIGWKIVKKEHFPVFIDVGIRRKPVKVGKVKKERRLSWFLPEDEVDAITYHTRSYSY